MTASGATRWLRLGSAVTVVVGLLAAAAGSDAAGGPWLLLFDVVDWPLDGEPARFTAETKAVNAVAGGVMVGWGTLMYLLAGSGAGRVTAATPMLAGVVAWFVVDATGSLLAGLPENLVLNVGFLALLLPPLLVLRRREVLGGQASTPASERAAAVR